MFSIQTIYTLIYKFISIGGIQMKKLFWILAIAFLPLFMISCDEEAVHDPLDTFNEYKASFASLDFESMYKNLDAKSKENMTQEVYVKTYRDIYDSIPITVAKMENRMDNLDLYKKIEDKNEVRVPVNMSIIGEDLEQNYSIDIKLVKEIDETTGKGNFKVSFAYNLVYEGLQKTDKVIFEETVPERGRILDRNLKPIADNAELLWIGMVPGKLGADRNAAIAALSDAFGLTPAFITKRLGLSWAKENTFVDMIKVPSAEKEKVDALSSKYPGIIYRTLVDRTYPYKDAAAHLTGYLGLVNKEEYKELQPLGFPINTKVGRAGLEMIYEQELRGAKGVQAVLVDKDNNVKKVLGHNTSNQGKDIVLTIDIDKQVNLFNAMGGEVGAASLVNYKTGEIEALVSSPSYDPNAFVIGQSQESYDALIRNPKNPLLNRFSKLYVPGSVIKPITTALALDLIKFDENYEMNVEGLSWQKDASWGNYFVKRISEPGNPVNLEKAFIYSDNTYFAQMALNLGESNFIEGAKEYGIGSEISIGYPIETSQLANNGVMNNEILLADSGYGQGQVLINILTLPKAFTVFANGGNLVEMKLVKDDQSPISTKVTSPEIADRVFALMKNSIDSVEGTAHGAFLEGRNLGGKTGTAQVGNTELGWFSVIDKNDNSPYITTMMIEGVQKRGGSSITVDKVKEFLSAY